MSELHGDGTKTDDNSSNMSSVTECTNENPSCDPSKISTLQNGPYFSQERKFSASTSSSSSSDDECILLSFAPGDADNPINWSARRKAFIVVASMSAALNSTLGTALPSGAAKDIGQYFHIEDEEQWGLPDTTYLLGYVLGPVLFGPLSEAYGRRSTILITFFGFTLFTLACAVAPNWTSLLIFRLIVGINGSAPNVVVCGLYADIFDDPVTRGRAIALFMACTKFIPNIGPIISGFVSAVSWRWTFWTGLVLAGASWPGLLLVPETYGPVILQKRAARMREETGNPSIVAPIELKQRDWRQTIAVNLIRPIHMIIYESIVLLTCLYLSLAYSIFYLFFEAYPIIFGGIYGMSTGMCGLAFLPIGAGALLAFGIFLYYDSVLQRAKARNASWARVEDYRRLPLACIGGLLYVISLFWLGWTARSSVHWIVPMLAGLPFGIGFLLIFMALLNYLADAYEIYAASALAATSCCRSIAGAVLPLAARSMYSQLGVGWASSLLGFLSLGMVFVPFAFVKYGDQIRANSKFSLELLESKKSQGTGQPDSRRDITVAECEE